MLTVNIDMQDRLINGQTGNIRHIELDQGSTGYWYCICKIFWCTSWFTSNEITFRNKKFMDSNWKM